MPFIFSREALSVRTRDLREIYSAIAAYYEGVELARTELLEAVFHDSWLMKDTDNPGARSLNVEDKRTFLERVSRHGPYAGYAEDRRVAAISLAYDDLAFVRVDKDSSRSATCFFLFRAGGAWKIVDKAWVNPREDYADASADPRSLSAAARLVEEYFRSVSNRDLESLDALLHRSWDLKYLADDRVRAVTKDLYLEQVGAVKKGAYVDLTRLLSVETHQDGMAVVRVDLPRGRETIFLVLFEVGKVWQIASERRGAERTE